jgi:DNA primase
MSPLIKDSSLEAVLNAAEIVEVVSGYTSLRKRGATYLGLCPFHKEKTPSFTVSSDKGLYYCFGCGEGGDVVRFMERMENLSFSEAVEQLGERFGVTLEFEEGAKADSGRRDRDTRLLLALEKAATFYQRYLWETEGGRTARDYLETRGLGREVCDRFRVGLSPDEWRGLHRRAVKEGFTDRELEEAGLLISQSGKTYDRFRGRLMFPLVDHRGRVVGFGGRTLKDESPKYLNSPEGPVYQKGHLLYGLFQARRAIAEADEVAVVEGYTDILGLSQVGLANAVASMGTALTDAQIGLMTRFTNNVTFMFDADPAGTEAVLRSGELARHQGLRPLVAVLPRGQDPADLAVKGGAEAVTRVMQDKVSLIEFEVRKALNEGDMSTREGRVRATEAVDAVLARAASLKERQEVMPMVAEWLRLSQQEVELRLGDTSPRSPRRERAGPPAAEGRAGAGCTAGPATGAGAYRGSREALADMSLMREAADERELLVAAVCNPARAAELLDALTPEHFIDPGNREVFEGLRQALVAMEHSRDLEAVLLELKDRARPDSVAGSLFVRLVLEADAGRYSLGTLERLHLRVQEQFLNRSVTALRAQLEEGPDIVEVQRRLFHLDQLLHRVRLNLNGLDTDEGEA